MTHFIVYHNADRRGDIPKEARSRFDSSNKSRLEAALGHTVWIIQGKTPEARGAKKVFTLRGKFRPDSALEELEDEEGRYIITGEKEFSFNPPLVLNGLEWFDLLFVEQHNFRSGFNRISNPEIIAGLEDSVASYVRHEILKKEHRGKAVVSISGMRMSGMTRVLSRSKWANP
jgi:hypothetical protein